MLTCMLSSRTRSKKNVFMRYVLIKYTATSYRLLPGYHGPPPGVPATLIRAHTAAKATVHPYVVQPGQDTVDSLSAWQETEWVTTELRAWMQSLQRVEEEGYSVPGFWVWN